MEERYIVKQSISVDNFLESERIEAYKVKRFQMFCGTFYKSYFSKAVLMFTALQLPP